MEEALVAYLLAGASIAALVEDRIYWNELPQGKELPAVVLRGVSEVPVDSDEGEAGLTEHRVQIDCYGEDYGSAKAVARTIRARLSGAAFVSEGVEFQGAFLDNSQDLFERVQAPGQGVSARHRVSMDFQLWPSL